jgi:hypothetical protein
MQKKKRIKQKSKQLKSVSEKHDSIAAFGADSKAIELGGVFVVSLPKTWQDNVTADFVHPTQPPWIHFT